MQPRRSTQLCWSIYTPPYFVDARHSPQNPFTHPSACYPPQPPKGEADDSMASTMPCTSVVCDSSLPSGKHPPACLGSFSSRWRSDGDRLFPILVPRELPFTASPDVNISFERKYCKIPLARAHRGVPTDLPTRRSALKGLRGDSRH